MVFWISGFLVLCLGSTGNGIGDRGAGHFSEALMLNNSLRYLNLECMWFCFLSFFVYVHHNGPTFWEWILTCSQGMGLATWVAIFFQMDCRKTTLSMTFAWNVCRCRLLCWYNHTSTKKSACSHIEIQNMCIGFVYIHATLLQLNAFEQIAYISKLPGVFIPTVFTWCVQITWTKFLCPIFRFPYLTCIHLRLTYVLVCWFMLPKWVIE